MKGFTLVELMISIAIFLVIMVVFYMVLSINDISWDNMTAYIATQQEARKAMIFMTRELRSARSFTIPQPSQINFFTDTAGNVIYSLDTVNNRITRTATDTMSPIIANFITSLGFSNNSGMITIDISSQKTTLRNRLLRFDLKGRVFVRN